MPIKNIWPLVFINFLFSNVTPMATGGGLAQIWFLHEQGVKLGTATAATTLRTLLASLMIFIPTPFLFLLNEQLFNGTLDGIWPLTLGMFATGYLVFFLIVLLRIQVVIWLFLNCLRLLLRMKLLNEPSFKRYRIHLVREIVRFSQSVRHFFTGSVYDKFMAVGTTAVFLFSLFSFPALLLWGLGYTFDYITLIALMLINTFVMYFAPTPGAAGIAEGAFAIFFGTLLQSADLIFVILAWRFLTVHLGMIIGVPVTWYMLVAGAKRD